LKILKDKLIRSNKIEIRPSKVHGYGVFSREDIKENEIIEENPFVMVHDSPQEPCPKDLRNFVYGVEKNGTDQPLYKDVCAVSVGCGMLYNYDENFNVDYHNLCDEDLNIFVFTANRDVSKDEELFINYGECLNPEDCWGTVKD
jgi:SET domain-containing protein